MRILVQVANCWEGQCGMVGMGGWGGCNKWDWIPCPIAVLSCEPMQQKTLVPGLPRGGQEQSIATCRSTLRGTRHISQRCCSASKPWPFNSVQPTYMKHLHVSDTE